MATTTFSEDDEMYVCSICLVESHECGAATTSCDHKFHPQCLIRWYEKSDACPCCRAPQEVAARVREKVAQERQSRPLFMFSCNTLRPRKHETGAFSNIESFALFWERVTGAVPEPIELERLRRWMREACKGDDVETDEEFMAKPLLNGEVAIRCHYTYRYSV